MKADLQAHRVNLVFVGEFSPTLFQTSWMVSRKLIKEKVGESAKIDIIHPQVTKLSTEWFQLSATGTRLQIHTTLSPYFESLRDLGINIFKLLSQNPIRALGINSSFDITFRSSDDYNDLGYKLVPRKNWEKFLHSPGMEQVIVRAQREDDFEGYIKVTINPLLDENLTNGVRLEVNDHYQIALSEKPIPDGNKIVEILNTNYLVSIKNSKKYLKELIGVKA